jgi:hypothetical protein
VILNVGGRDRKAESAIYVPFCTASLVSL